MPHSCCGYGCVSGVLVSIRKSGDIVSVHSIKRAYVQSLLRPSSNNNLESWRYYFRRQEFSAATASAGASISGQSPFDRMVPVVEQFANGPAQRFLIDCERKRIAARNAQPQRRRAGFL